jgi:hypothetical protein
MSRNIAQQIKNLENKIARNYNAYLSNTMNNPGRYGRFRENSANTARLAQLRKNLNAAINKEGGQAVLLRNAEKNLKNVEKNHPTKLIMLRREYPQLWTITPHMSYKTRGMNSAEYNRREKALMNKLNRAKARVSFLKRMVNARQRKAVAVIEKHVKKRAGLLSRIRHEPNYGIEYAKTRAASSLATPRTNENWARMLREARRQGRQLGVNIGRRRAMKNIFKY